jgi:hypothetical protein
MDIGKAFSFPFEDKDWISKILIVALISLIPIVGQLFVTGWGLEIARRIIRQDLDTLPGYNDFGGYILRGFLVGVIGFIYAIPLIVVSSCAWLPYTLIPNPDENMNGLLAIVSICVSCLVAVFALIYAFILPAAIGKYAATDQFGSAFRLGDAIATVRAVPTAYFLVLVGALLGFVLIAPLGSVLCGLGALLTTVYANALYYHLLGQAYLESNKLSGITVNEPA